MSDAMVDLIKQTIAGLERGPVSSNELAEAVAGIELAYDAKLTADLQAVLDKASHENELILVSIGRTIGIKTNSLSRILEVLAADADAANLLSNRRDLAQNLEGILKAVALQYQYIKQQNRKELENIKSNLVSSIQPILDVQPDKLTSRLERQNAFIDTKNASVQKPAAVERPARRGKLVRQDAMIWQYPDKVASTSEKKSSKRKRGNRANKENVTSRREAVTAASSSAPASALSVNLDYITYISDDHGKPTSRDITILNGIPFYKSSGKNSGQGGTWFPFKGVLSEPATDEHGRPIMDQRNIPGFFRKPGVSPFKMRNYIPQDVLSDLKMIQRDLHERLPCLHHVLYSSLIGGGLWETKEGQNLKQKLKQKYPEFYELNPNLVVSRCVKSIDDYDSQKGLSTEQLMRPAFYQNAEYHFINDWLVKNGKVAEEDISPLLDKQDRFLTKPIQEVNTQDTPKKKAR